MSATDIQILLASIGAFLTAVGIGAKWLLMYVAGKQTEAALAESAARVDLSARLHDEIRVLRIELAGLHAENRVYLRRIFQLEAFIHNQPGIAIPAMEGWPPV